MSKKDVAAAQKAEQEALDNLNAAQAAYEAAREKSLEVQAANAPKASQARNYQGQVVMNDKEFQEARKHG